MAEPARKKPRITEDLHTLGRILHQPNTPKQRVSKQDGNAMINRILVRTPGSVAARTPSGHSPSASARARGQGSVRRAAPTTPHAIRALNQRRTAVLASGGNRRRTSAVAQRETPRNDLRALSRVLAKKTKPPTEPQEQRTPRRRSIISDENVSPAVEAPRLSLALQDLDDDSFHEQAPRLSYPLDQDDEIELRRRAALGRSRPSFEYMVDESLLGVDDLVPREYEDITERRRQLLEQDIDFDPYDINADGETGDLRTLMGAQRDLSPAHDATEVTDGEPTFLFRIPERSRLSMAPTTASRTPGRQLLDDTTDHYDDERLATIAGAEFDEDINDEQLFDGFPLVDGFALRQDSMPALDEEERAQPNEMRRTKRLPKELKVSKHGTEYPTFPTAVIKRVATTFSRSFTGSGKLNKDTLTAMQQASDWFFEQVSEDLMSYADHAGRKTIDEADMVTLMKRQRVLSKNTTLFSLASQFLPRELLQDVRMQPQPKARKRKRTQRPMGTIEEEEDIEAQE